MNEPPKADTILYPAINLLDESGVNAFVSINFAETENDPVSFDALTIVCPISNKSAAILALVKKVAQNYSSKKNLKLQLCFTPNDYVYVNPKSRVADEDFLPKYVDPKRKTGTYAPLVITDAPLDLNKPFETTADSKLLFTDGFGVRIKDIPGIVLNDCYPGSNGAVYSIDYSMELKEWSLYKCHRTKACGGFVVEIEKVGRSLTLEEFKAEPNSVTILYDELEKAEIYLRGDQVIVLGLPIHNGNF